MKAVFLYKFIPYVRWPAKAYPRDGVPFVVGATDPDMVGTLRSVLDGREVNGHPIEIRKIASSDDVDAEQVVFIGAGQASWLQAIARRTRGRAILVVCESSGALEHGAVVNFLLRDGRVRFEVSLTAAGERGLAISSQLLEVADSVEGGPP